MGRPRWWVWGLLFAVVLIGCGQVPEEPEGTGPKECVQGYYEALIQKDWSQAYASLDPRSRQRCNIQQFIRSAQAYRSHLGLEPEWVHIRAWEAERLARTRLGQHDIGIQALAEIAAQLQ